MMARQQILLLKRIKAEKSTQFLPQSSFEAIVIKHFALRPKELSMKLLAHALYIT